MRELSMHEANQVSGGGTETDLEKQMAYGDDWWKHALQGLGGGATIGAGVAYTLSTGGVGGLMGGAAIIASGVAAVSDAFDSAYSDISSAIN